MSETSDLFKECLSNFAKKAPHWAAGIAVVILTVSVAYTMMYTTSKESIDAYMKSSIHQDEINVENNKSVLESMIKIVNDNTSQLMSISSSLHDAQVVNRSLTARVDVIETDLKATRESLVSCKGSLEECTKKLRRN